LRTKIAGEDIATKSLQCTTHLLAHITTIPMGLMSQIEACHDEIGGYLVVIYKKEQLKAA
jgi:hypothetical protein